MIIGLRSGFCENGPGKQGSTCIEKCGCEKGKNYQNKHTDHCPNNNPKLK